MYLNDKYLVENLKLNIFQAKYELGSFEMKQKHFNNYVKTALISKNSSNFR